jgi:Cu-processing system permease protein
MHDVLSIAHLTLFEARRKRVVLAAVLVGLVFLAVFGTALFFVMREFMTEKTPLITQQLEIQFITTAGLYGANFLAVMLAVLLPVDTLSGEISSGVLQTIASKPISRASIVVGKWFAFLVIAAGYLALVAGGVVLVSRAVTGFMQPNLVRALPLMLLEATVLLTVSIAGGTRLSTVTNGICAFGFYGIAFIGGWVEQIGALIGNDTVRNIGVFVSLISPADALWRLGAYHLQPAIARDLQMTPFSSASVPNLTMVAWAVLFVMATMAFALRQFRSRAL